MKSVKWVLGVGVLLVVVLIAAGFFLPAHTHLEYKTNIGRSPQTVYNLLADPSEFENWAPWEGAGEGVEYTVERPGRGLNGAVQWRSDRSAVGSGRLTIIDARPHDQLRMLLDYSGGRRAVLGFQLEPLDSGTHVTWTYRTEYGGNPFSRYKGLLHEHRVKKRYNPSLERLRGLAERRPEEQSESDIATETVTYEVDGAPYQGYLAFDKSRQNRPGVLVVHEWWGHTDYVRERAEQLAELGYVAFALDMYGDGKTVDHPDAAGKLSKQVNENFDAARARFTKALQILKDHPATDPEQTAAIGYCFGGGIVLNMARAGVDLDGVVSFHGSLMPVNERARRGDINASILVLNGADDPLVPREQIEAFMQEMDSAGVDYEFINYPGARHAFTNPVADEYAKQFDLPLKYNADADEQSWRQMRAFLARVFE